MSHRTRPGSEASTQPSEARERPEDREVVLVSACLLGAACRYDGTSKTAPPLRRWLFGKAVVPICPEAAAGLGTPRPAVELHRGDGRAVWEGMATARTVEAAQDRTEAFRTGARMAVDAARAFGARLAVLKQRSPSCGSTQVWIDGELKQGEGVTCALLRQEGLTVIGEDAIKVAEGTWSPPVSTNPPWAPR